MDPFFLRLSRASYVFSAKLLLGGDSWVSAAACAAPGLSLLPVVPKTEEQGAVGVLKPLTSDIRLRITGTEIESLLSKPLPIDLRCHSPGLRLC